MVFPELRAEDCWQSLRQGINLLNLLDLYPARSNPAIMAMIESLLDEGSLRLALADLQLLQSRLLELPEVEGTEVSVRAYPELEGGPLKELLGQLALLYALYEGKNGKGATALVQQKLTGALWEDPHAVQLALVRLHQLKG